MARTRNPRAPGLFQPSIPRRTFDRKILGRVAVNEERRFLEGLYSFNAERETYERPETLDPEQVRRLKTIAAAVRHNRGVLQPAKLALLGMIAAAIVVFVLFFADALIERAATRGLESLFQARVEFSDLRVRPLQPGFGFNSLQVADRNRPYRNLFELGRAEVRLDLGQLLRGKLVVRNIEAQEIRWNTRRESSGALPPERLTDPREPEAPGLELPDLRELAIERFAEIDPEEFVRAHFEQLTTPAHLSELAEELEAAGERYRSEIPRLERTARSAADHGQEAAALRPAELRSVDAIRDAYRTVERAYSEIDTAVAEVRTLHREAEQDVERYRTEIEAVGDLVAADLAYVRGLVPEIDLTDRSAIAALVLPELYDPLHDRYRQIRTIWDAVDRLRTRERPADPTARRSGRTIVFPARDYPRVLLEQLSFSVGGREARDLHELRVEAISSQPELVENPSRVQFTRFDGPRTVTASGVLDMRGETAPRDSGNGAAQERLRLATSMEGFAFELGGRSGIVSFDQAEGNYDLSADLQFARSGVPTGTVRLGLEELELAVPDDDRIATLAREIFYSVPRVTVDFELRPEGRLRAGSNLDRPFREQLAGYLSERRVALQQRIAAELDARLAAELQRREEQLAELNAFREQAEGYLAQVRLHRAEVADLRDRLERRTAELEEEAERRVREAAEQARREAEERARREAERQIDRALDRFR